VNKFIFKKIKNKNKSLVKSKKNVKQIFFQNFNFRKKKKKER